MGQVSHVTTEERLSNRNLWSFTAGGLGRDMAYNLWNGSLLICIMYTKNVSAAQISVIMVMMALCRIWDAVNDPVMGGIIERTRTKWGKFKPWIFIGAITNAIVTFSIFAVPLKGRDFVIFFPFAYLLWDITYTMNDIGYWAMLPSLTSNDEDRNKLSTLAIILGGVGSAIAGLLVPVATIGSKAIGGNAITGFTAIAAIIGVVFIGCQTMTCCCVKEKPLPPVSGTEKVGIKQMFRVIFKNKQLLWIALVMILYNLGTSLNYASTTNYIYFRFSYEGGYASVFSILGSALAAISIIYPMLSKRFSRKQITVVSVAMAVIGYVVMFIIGATTMNVTNDKLIFAMLIITTSVVVCGQTMFYMVQTVSIANTIEYNEWKTGSRDEGIIFAVRPFMGKMGSALVAVVQLFVYGIWRSSVNNMSIADYTDQISELENMTNLLLANQEAVVATGGNAEQAAAMQEMVAKAGVSYADVQAQLIAADKGAEFADVIGKLKALAIDNTLSSVDNGALLWLLFCLSILPMLFVIFGFIVWMKKYKIDEKTYADMVAEIAQRKTASGGETGGAEPMDGNVETSDVDSGSQSTDVEAEISDAEKGAESTDTGNAET